MRPKILLACSARWMASARLANSLGSVGFQVEAVAPPGHPLKHAAAVNCIYPYRAFRPISSIAGAIERSRPTALIPCDDLATVQLHRLYERSDSETASGAGTRKLIERSLGNPSSFRLVTARSLALTRAVEIGLTVPATALVESKAALGDWLRQNGLPAVLKVNQGSIRRSVVVVDSVEAAMRVWDRLTAPPTPAWTIKRALINREMNHLGAAVLRRSAQVSAQRFVYGEDANAAVLCSEGRVRASVTVRVLRTIEAQGPASVVQLFEHPEISATIQALVADLALTGLVGFDFVIERATGAAHLIEINPRATQTSHLRLGVGRDLPGALWEIISGRPSEGTSPITTNKIIALFPQEWLRDPSSEFLTSGYHDVPWDDANLVRTAVTADQRQAIWKAIGDRTRSLRGNVKYLHAFDHQQRNTPVGQREINRGRTEA